MKKTTLTLLLICMTSGLAFGQASQSLSFNGPASWVPGTQITLNVTLTYSGYTSIGFGYWLEVPNAIAPSLSITNAQYFTFLDPNNAFGFPLTFTSTSGARSGYMTAGSQGSGDLGATTNPQGLPAGSYPVTTLTFSLAAGAPLGTYTMYSTSIAPRISYNHEISPGFDDHPFPVAPFVFTVVPEPSTLALFSLAGLGCALLTFRRRKVVR